VSVFEDLVGSFRERESRGEPLPDAVTLTSGEYDAALMELHDRGAITTMPFALFKERAGEHFKYGGVEIRREPR